MIVSHAAYQLTKINTKFNPTPQKPQLEDNEQDKMTQVIQPNTCPVQYMTRHKFEPTTDKDIKLGWGNVFKSAFYTKDGKRKKCQH